MTCGISPNDIPSVEIRIAETPADAVEYDDDLIKFSNITIKTPSSTVRNFTSIDVETTGLSAEKSEIIEVCAIRFRDGLPTEKFSTLTSPKKSITGKITKINGITNDMVKDHPHFSLIADSLVEFIGNDNIVGHNLDFDIRFLLQHGADVTKVKRKYFDTLTLARYTLRKPVKRWDPDSEEYEIDYDDYDVENFKLSTLCEYYSISLQNAHRATGDSYAAGMLFLELANEKTSRSRYYSNAQIKDTLAEVDPEEEASRTDSQDHVTSNNRAEMEFVDADELRSWPHEKFFAWSNKFLQQGKQLPRDIDQSTFHAVQNQLQIINEEIARRSKQIEMLKKASRVNHKPEQPVKEDWVDKIAPILPLVYVLWFCGIAAGTFSLLSLIFK